MSLENYLSADFAQNQSAVEEPSSAGVLYMSPANWPLEESDAGVRKRRYIRFSERPNGFDVDLDCLKRTLEVIVPQQQASGCFISPEDLLKMDKTDDHLGVSGMLAYYLSLTGENEQWEDALRRAASFQLENFCWEKSGVAGRYVRFDFKRDTPLDWCNTLWSLQGLNFVLQYGRSFLTQDLYAELEKLGRDFWDYLTKLPSRDENPCHNQLIEYASIGYSYGQASGRSEVCEYVLEYYRTVLRKLRILDRGRWIYAEFNSWCGHYALLSWCALEHLFAESGDAEVEADAIEMAAAFNDRLSAGGFYFGGSRRDEPGYETFLYQFWLRGQTFNFDRLLLPEPSNQWRNLIYDGHNGRSLISEMTLYAKKPVATQNTLGSSAHTLMLDRCSVRLNEDATLHHLSVNGLELLAANFPNKLRSPLWWKNNGTWLEDRLLATPPPASQLQSFHTVREQTGSGLEVRATMQRGGEWEICQWWISDGKRLQWVAHFVAHSSVRSEQVKFVFANPYLAEFDGEVGPVSLVSSSKESVTTCGPSQLLESTDYLQIGDQFIRSSHPLSFVRPSEHAFDGFPARNRKLWSRQEDSNRIEILLSAEPKQFDFRESFFAGLEVGSESTAAAVTEWPEGWEYAGALGSFKAVETNGVWSYVFEPQDAAPFQLLNPAFGLLTSES